MYGLYSQAQPNTGNLKMAKLDGILFQSDYNNKSDVRKYCEELLKNYDTLDCFSAPNPGKQPSRVVEIHGTIPVNFRGTFYHLMVSFIFPPLFPNVPPLVYLVNPDAKRFSALQKYDSKKQLFPNGKYYYPIAFSEVTGWISHKNIMRIVKQMVVEFGNEYPLFEATNANSLFKSSLHYQQQQQSKVGMIGQNYQNNAQNVTTNISNNWGTNTFTNTNMNLMGGTTQNTRDQLLAVVRKKYSEEALTIAKKLEKDLNTQRNNMVELQNLTLKLQDEEAKLQKFEDSAPIIISDLEEKIQGIEQIINIQQGTALTAETLKTTIEEVDEVSKMLMDLVSTNKAIEDLNIFAEELFNAGKLDLETYLKIYKDNTEREFMNNVWIRKLISATGGN